jgi:hypothetical protein
VAAFVTEVTQHFLNETKWYNRKKNIKKLIYVKTLMKKKKKILKKNFKKKNSLQQKIILTK